MLLDAFTDGGHHLEVDAQQVVAAHAGLARHAGGDDDDVRAGDRLVGTGAGELGVEALHGAGFGEVERLALRHAVDDVEQHDVAEFLHCRQMGERAADLTRADQCDLVTRHEINHPRVGPRQSAALHGPTLSRRM